MKYIDRKSIALERFFAKRSELLTHLDELTEEGLPEALGELSAFRRLQLCFIARDSLRTLRDSYDVSGHIPQEVLALAGMSPLRIFGEGRLTGFLQWLRALQLKNAQQRIPWETSIKSAAARLGSPADSFVRAFFALSNQRVFISLRGDVLTVTPAEREWGIATVHFHGVSLDTLPPMPLPGFSIAAECDDSDRTRPVFTMLIDPHFGETKNDFADRLLSDEGWQTVSFAYSDITVDTAFTDYVARLDICGASKADVLFEVCRILLGKRLLVGADALNRLERGMMPEIGLIGALRELSDKEPGDFADWQCEDIILETLSNRCAIRGFIDTLKKYRCDDLALPLEKAAEESYNEHEAEALKYAKVFGLLLDQKLADGTMRPLLHYLYDQFRRMSALNTDTTDRLLAERWVLEQIDEELSPTLRQHGFAGKFPNFMRSRQGRVEYISFMLDRQSDRVSHGVMTYGASIAAAQLDSRRLEQYKKQGVEQEETTALDCLPEAPEVSLYGELCNSSDSGPAAFDIDIYAGSTPQLLQGDFDKLYEHLGFAEHQFSAGRLPSGYRRRPSLRESGGAFGRAFLHCLPLALTATLMLLGGYLLFGEALMERPLTRPAAAGLGLLAGLVFNCIASGVRCALSSRRLWKY